MAKHHETKAEEHREEEKKKREHRKRGGHVGHKKRAKGGAVDGEEKAEVTEYNAQGSPAMRAAKKTKDDGFRRGGAAHHEKHKKHMKHGGHVEGEKEHERLDKRARGGHVGHKHHGHRAMARGGSPYSIGRHGTMSSTKDEAGHEGEHVA